MMTWSIPAGRLLGIELRVHFTLLLFLVVLWFSETQAHGERVALRAVILMGLLFGSVVLHEVGHAVTAVSSGVAVRAINLLPIGGVTVLDQSADRTPDPGRDLRIAIAGPLVNLALGVFCGSFILLFLPQQVKLFEHPFVTALNLPRSFVWSNLLLGGFNLLPAFPLDGGRVLRALLARGGDYAKATRRTAVAAQLIALAMLGAGLFYVNWWLVMVGMLIFLGAQMEDRSALFNKVMESIRMEEIMLTDFATLSPADTLEDALQKSVHSLQDDFPVVRGSDMVGTISRQSIVENLRASGNGYVQAAMNRAFQIAQRSETLAAVMRRVGRSGLTLVPIVDGEHLVGIVTLQNLTHSIATLAETRRAKQNQE